MENNEQEITNELNNDKRTSSVTVKLTAKGQYTWEIKYYFDKDKEVAEGVVANIAELDTKLKNMFGGQ